MVFFDTNSTFEPLSAIIPGAALQELWGLVGTAETALSIVSAMVVATALLGEQRVAVEDGGFSAFDGHVHVSPPLK